MRDGDNPYAAIDVAEAGGGGRGGSMSEGICAEGLEH